PPAGGGARVAGRDLVDVGGDRIGGDRGFPVVVRAQDPFVVEAGGRGSGFGRHGGPVEEGESASRLLRLRATVLLREGAQVITCGQKADDGGGRRDISPASTS